jgi:hypothetical protein
VHTKAGRIAPVKSYVFRVVVEDDAMETLANVREAVELYVEDLRESGSRIPVDPELGGLEWPTPAVAVNL